MMHPPLGPRGAGGMRTGGLGLDPVAVGRHAEVNDVWRILMSEEYWAVERVEKIVSVEYRSAVFIGLSDRSMSMGLACADTR